MNLLNQIRSIRFVLTLWYTFLLMVAFGLFGGSVYIYLQHLMESKLDQDLLGELDGVSQIIDLDRSRLRETRFAAALSDDVRRRIAEHFGTNPFNYLVLLTTRNGDVLYESDVRASDMLQGQDGQSRETILSRIPDSPLGELRVASRRSDPFVIRVAYTNQTMQTVLGHLVSIFAVLAPVMLFVAFAGGWTMAGLILRPIRSITSTADRITAQNLTERIPERKTKDELGNLIDSMNRTIARLQTSFDQIRQFSMNVAHELKTPLTILKGESELALSSSIPPDEVRALMTSYLEETIRMSRIVDDLLTLAKADPGQLPIRREPVRIDDLVKELYEDALLLSTGKNLRIELRETASAYVLGDETRLRQLFRILISNAVQYTDRGGSIILQCDVEASHVAITFEDTGVGIPAESIDKIFERFYRVDHARTRSTGGSGLGLSIAKWITEIHSGTISVASQAGKGSRFTVRLPLYQPPASPLS